MPPTIALSWSGGIDSTSCLWQLLRDGKSVLAHHVRLKNREGREPYEKAAVDAIREWFKTHGLTNYVYHETGFDYGNLKHIVRDINITAFAAGVILARYPSVIQVVYSSSADDERRLSRDPNIQARRQLLTELMAGCWRDFGADDAYDEEPTPCPQCHVPIYQGGRTAVRTGRKLQWLAPNIQKTKAQVMAEMPPDLLALCWYCRRPKGGKPCGECYTCRVVAAGRR